MNEEKKELKCPKCGSVALTGSETKMPHTSKAYKRFRCLNCGVQFDMLGKE